MDQMNTHSGANTEHTKFTGPWKLMDEGPWEINEYGTIRTLYTTIRWPAGHIVTWIKMPGNCTYPGAVLHSPAAGKKVRFSPHRLVAKYFLGEKPSALHQINHIDGNKWNNHYSNLEWCTHQQNIDHAVQHGLIAHLISDEKKNSIFIHLALGKTISEISRITGVGRTTIHRFRRQYPNKSSQLSEQMCLC